MGGRRQYDDPPGARNFLNPADDEYPLPQPARVNDRRIVQALIVVVLTPPIDQYSVALIVKQDGRELDRVSLEGGRTSLASP